MSTIDRRRLSIDLFLQAEWPDVDWSCENNFYNNNVTIRCSFDNFHSVCRIDNMALVAAGKDYPKLIMRAAERAYEDLQNALQEAMPKG